MTSRKFSHDELLEVLAPLPHGSDVRAAFAQLVAERHFFRYAAPYVRELCEDVSRRASDTTLDWLCSELGQEPWRDAPPFFQGFGPPEKPS